MNPGHKRVWSPYFPIRKKEVRVVCYGYCHLVEEEASKEVNLRFKTHQGIASKMESASGGHHEALFSCKCSMFW